MTKNKHVKLLRAISWRAFWTAAAALGWKDCVDGAEYRHETDELLRAGVLVEDHGTIWLGGDSMTDQERVFSAIRSAIKTLLRAQTLEHQIETERIDTVRRVSQRQGWEPGSASITHDPLGRKIGNIIEQLQDL